MIVIYVKNQKRDINKTWLPQEPRTVRTALMSTKNSTVVSRSCAEPIKMCNSMMCQLDKTDNEPNSPVIFLHGVSQQRPTGCTSFSLQCYLLTYGGTSVSETENPTKGRVGQQSPSWPSLSPLAIFLTSTFKRPYPSIGLEEKTEMT